MVQHHHLEIIQLVTIIERRLHHEKLDLAELAKVSGYSRWHLQRMFNALTGETLGNYVRKRKLTRAAEQLLATDGKIIDIALDFGFEGQESFSRAFKQHFGISPGALRKDSNPPRQLYKEVLQIHDILHLQETLNMQPNIINQDELKLIGLSAPFRGVFHKSPNNDEVIPKLQQDFQARLAEVDHDQRTGSVVYGIVSSSGDDESVYHAMVAVRSFDAIPDGFSKLTLPEGRMALFRHKGSPDTINNTIKYVFGTWVPRSKEAVKDGLEIEVYPEGFSAADADCYFDYGLMLSS